MDSIESKVSLIDWFDERMNPMAVRYFRQAVQNRSLILMVIVFLVIQIGVSLIMSMRDAGLYAGQNMFYGITACWGIMACLAVPSYMSKRVAADLGDKLDMTSITTMSPFKYINGIFFVGVTILVLMTSICLPFMVFCYILRGIGMVEIFTVIISGLTFSLIILMMGIMCGTFPNKKGKSAGGVLLVLMFLFSGGFIGHGIVGYVFGFSSTWFDGAITSLIYALLMFGLFYLISVFKVSPEMSNRMLPLRIYVTIMLALIPIVCIMLPGFTLDAFETALESSVVLISLSLIIAVSEQDSVSLRVRTQIPRSRLFRFFAWFFYSGSAAGVCWCVAAYAITLLLLRWVGGDTLYSFIDALYIYCFCMTGLFIRKVILRDTLRPSATFGIIVLLFITVHVIVHTFCLMAMPYRGSFMEIFDRSNLPWWSAFSPLAYMGCDDKIEFSSKVLAVLSIWAGVLTVVMIPWFLDQIKHFSPISRDEIMVLEK